MSTFGVAAEGAPLRGGGVGWAIGRASRGGSAALASLCLSAGRVGARVRYRVRYRAGVGVGVRVRYRVRYRVRVGVRDRVRARVRDRGPPAAWYVYVYVYVHVCM